MAKIYLYQCDQCESQLEITEKQAGMAAPCPSCDHSVQLPPLREIKNLPTRESESATGRSNRSGLNETRRWLFSGGLLVGALAGLIGLALFLYARSLSSESKANQIIEVSREQAGQLPPAYLWQQWDDMTVDGLPEWTETPDNRYNKQSFYLTTISYGLFGLAFAGVAAMVASLAINNR